MRRGRLSIAFASSRVFSATVARVGPRCLIDVGITRECGDRYVSVYSGPLPPSGGVSLPPLAVMAPHWTQFEGAS
jgi:hypothetical protein